MNKIEITQNSEPIAISGTDGATNMAFARAVKIPVHRQFSKTPIDTVEAMLYSDAALSDEALATAQELAGHFRLEERRPEDRSAPQLHMLFDERAFGKPFTYEVGSDTHAALRQHAGDTLAREIRDFPCK